MATLYKLRNISGTDGEFEGQDIADNEIYVIGKEDLETFRTSEEIMIAVATSVLQVESETVVFTNPVEGWTYLEGELFPKSSIDGKKLAVHTSYKPDIGENSVIHAVWTGSGDNIDTGEIGEGDLLEFDLTPSIPMMTKEIKFLPAAGRVWIHEGYLRFENGGPGDYITANIVSPASQLQTAVNLDLILDGEEVKYSPSGPGTGTTGFAASPALVPRYFMNDGGWDYDGVDLTPNFTGTGGFKIFNTKQNIHKYINRLPCVGSSPFFTMSSNETSELIQPYYLELTCHNTSLTTWNASVIVEIYREKTI